MRPSEARLVLTKLFGAYRTTADEATVLVYAEALSPVDLDIALGAVAAVIQTEDRLPSVSRLMAVVRVEHDRVTRSVRALPPPKPRNWQQVQLEGVRRARSTLHHSQPRLPTDLMESSA